MPYKPTGRPNGRPRKIIAEPVEDVQPKRPAMPQKARRQFRRMAEALNPSPFVVPLDNRGRPRHKPRHSSVKA